MAAASQEQRYRTLIELGIALSAERNHNRLMEKILTLDPGNPDALNFVGYANPEADSLLEEGRAMLDPALRKPVYDRFQAVVHEDQPYCFLYTPYALPIVSSRIQGVEPAPAGISWNFTRWWIPTSQQKAQFSQ